MKTNGFANKRLLRSEEGFTLVEMLVTMLIMLTVLFALYSIFDMSIRVFSFGNNKVEAVQNARVGLEKMTREIKAAYPVDKPIGKDYLFFSAAGATTDPPQFMPTSTQITLGNDLDADRKIQCPNTQSKCEYITYKLSGTTLLRNNTANASSGGDAVAENVKDVDGDGKALTFNYLKSNGTTATSESDIRIVRLKLEVSKSSGSLGDGTQTATTDIALRNR